MAFLERSIAALLRPCKRTEAAPVARRRKRKFADARKRRVICCISAKRTLRGVLWVFFVSRNREAHRALFFNEKQEKPVSQRQGSPAPSDDAGHSIVLQSADPVMDGLVQDDFPNHGDLRFVFDSEENPLAPLRLDLDLFSWTAPGKIPFQTKAHIDVAFSNNRRLCDGLSFHRFHGESC